MAEEGDSREMNYFFTGTLLFFFGGLMAIFVNEKFKAAVFFIFSSIAQLFILPGVFNVLISGNEIVAHLYLSEPIGISFIRLDPLSAVFVLIISIGALLAAVYSAGYMKMYSGRKAELSGYYFFLGIMVSSMLLVVTVQNAILFLISWEVMSISSFFLVSFENNKENVHKAGIYYFIAMQIGAAFLITAFSWVTAISGSLDFASFKTALTGSGGISVLLFILFFIGFGTKAGFIPMHTWLPKAHPAAPTGVSAIMSGVMIKTGIYGILRILLLSGTPDIKLSYFVFIISLATGIYGIANAIAQQDLKKLLAYSSIENIGIIGMGIGTGMLGLSYNQPVIALLGFLGAILHVLNHFVFKTLLFYGAGIVYHKTGTRNIEKLGGLIKVLPITSSLFLIGSVAICGMPLFNGFISEFAIYLGMAKGFAVNSLAINIVAVIGISGLALIGIMAVLCFTKVFGICFLGTPRSLYKNDFSEKSFSYILPMATLSAFIIIIGFLPGAVLPLISSVIKQFIKTDFTNDINSIVSLYQYISLSLLLFAGIVIFFLLLRYLLLRNRSVVKFKTWDCGYQAASNLPTGQAGRIQYTGSSFTQPFLRLIAELVPQKIKVEKEPVLFPKEGSIEIHSHDSSERFLIQPLIKLLNKSLNYFSWIQSGQMQQYIIYGLIFLLFLLIWTWGTR
jgi:formate hydrogenlyase subunit 3/multisubunit Na+/H+ antiporter MnhD subunit